MKASTLKTHHILASQKERKKHLCISDTTDLDDGIEN